MAEYERVQVELDNITLDLAWDGTWFIRDTSGCIVFSIEQNEIADILDKVGLKIVSK